MLGNLKLLLPLNMLLPEIILIVTVLTAQTTAVFLPNKARIISLLLITSVFLLAAGPVYYSANYSGDEARDLYFKAIVLMFGGCCLILYRSYCKITGAELKIEFFTIVLLSLIGTCIAISSREFITFFCGLELQALAGYALAAFDDKNYKSSEAGLKYFVLGGLTSCLMLFGISFIYGYGGSTQFTVIAGAFGNSANIAVLIGTLIVLAALFFKLSAAPLHVWTPDVYEGAPVASVSYFAAAQKIGVLFVATMFLSYIMGGDNFYLRNIIKIVAIMSMIIGSLGAIVQKSLKRLAAYSTILNIGYAMIPLALPVFKPHAAHLYIFIYAVSIIGFFACLVGLIGKRAENASFDDIKGVAAMRKTLAAALAIIMFSMIGIPPFAGFWAKYYIFYEALKAEELLLAFVGLISSVVSAFYYLKIVKYVYFTERSVEEIVVIPTDKGLLLISTASILFIVFFFAFAARYLQLA